MLDEVSGQIDGLDMRDFQLLETEQRLRINLSATQQSIHDRGASHSKQLQDEAAITEQEIRDISSRRLATQGKRAELQAQARVLLERSKSCNKLVLQATAGRKLVFLDPVEFNPKTTVRVTREKLKELQDRLHDTENAPVPSKIAKERWVNWIDQRAAHVNPAALIERAEGGGGIHLPRTMFPASGGASEAVNAFGILCSLPTFRKELIAQGYAHIERRARDEEALDDEQLKKKLAALKAEILETEKLDESICWSLLQAGKSVELLPTADARAILSVRVER
ncbi:MAG: hypothetical protein ABSD31_20700 [Candidatus Binataceae bacterium]|jgi:hypothetical protein